MVGELGLREGLGQRVGWHLGCRAVLESYGSLLGIVAHVRDLDAVVFHATMERRRGRVEYVEGPLIVVVDGEWFVRRNAKYGQEAARVDRLTCRFGECGQFGFGRRERNAALELGRPVDRPSAEERDQAGYGLAVW